MVKLKSWGGAALVIAALLLTMQSVSAFEVVDGTPKTLVFHNDGTFDDFTSNQLEAYPLEAGDDVSNIEYILVRHDTGGFEYVPAQASYALEWFSPRKTYDSASECNSRCTSTYADSYCRNYGNRLSDGPDCDGATCIWECNTFGNTCTKDSDCDKSRNCAYCQIGTDSCGSDDFCDYARCGIAVECGMGCSNDDEAMADCVDQYEGSSKYVKSAKCSGGQPVCVTGSRGSVECSSYGDPRCDAAAAAACTYGYTGGKCNIEKDCQGDIVRSECVWQCKSKPVTQVCGDGDCTGSENTINCPSDCGSNGPVCGDGNCEGGETQNNCPRDCGTESCTTSSDCSGTQICNNGECVPGGVDPGSCGNGRCDYGESVACPSDCASLFCGNGICDSFENERTCAYDCGNNLPVCGNGLCESGETSISCYNDCGTPDLDCNSDSDCIAGQTCDNGECVGNSCSPGYIGEPYCEGKDLVQKYKTGSCSEYVDKITTCDLACKDGKCDTDIPDVDVCGDGECGATENAALCPDDCTNIYCGDGICNEEPAYCPNDCDTCGNGVCDAGESLATCPSDCFGGGGEEIMIAAIIVIIGAGVLLFYLMKRK